MTVIERQVGHLTRLVDDLLDVSRITRGKVASRKRLSRLRKRWRKPSRSPPRCSTSGPMCLTLTFHGSSGCEAISIRLSQVVSNLLTNAAKYTRTWWPHHRSSDRRARRVVIRVRDTGIGIAPDVLPHVFDLFVQERQDIDRSQGGLGLGLTIVRNLVERHGGTVSAHSDGPGTGSEFVVRLPRANAPADLRRPADLNRLPTGSRIERRRAEDPGGRRQRRWRRDARGGVERKRLQDPGCL